MIIDGVRSEAPSKIDIEVVLIGVPIAALIFAIPGRVASLVLQFGVKLPGFVGELLMASAISPFLTLTVGVPVGWCVAIHAAHRRWIGGWACAAQGATTGVLVLAVFALHHAIFSGAPLLYFGLAPWLLWSMLVGAMIGLIYWRWLRWMQPKAFADPQ